MKYILLMAIAFSSIANSDLERKIEILAEEIQLLKSNQLQQSTNQTFGNLGPAASKAHFIKSGISIGGYGEIVYTDKAGSDESNNDLLNRPSAEALRGVLYFGYKFEDGWTLNTEIEIEHVNEIFLEFAYLDKEITPLYNFRAGLVLMPMGLVNQAHEPTLFFSVNRPTVEKLLIPTTWRELGFGLYGRHNKLSYETYIVNGSDATDFADSKIFRGSRKKGGSGGSDAGSLASVTRVDYQIDSNNSVGGSIYFGEASGNGSTIDDVNHSIFDLHFRSKYNNWTFRGLFVQNHFNEGDVKTFNAQTSRALPTQMRGFYLEAGYDFKLTNEAVVTPFFRYENYNLHEEVESSQTEDLSKDVTNYILGVNYKPIDRVVFKLDYQKQENEAKTGVDQISLGMGYYF